MWIISLLEMMDRPKFKAMPTSREYAKESMEPVPNTISRIPTAAVVTLQSSTAEKARLYPAEMAPFKVFPALISSLIRSEMMILESTPIPIERIIPAIPGRVSVRPIRWKTRS